MDNQREERKIDGGQDIKARGVGLCSIEGVKNGR